MDTLTAALTPHQQAMLLHHQQLLHEANVAECRDAIHWAITHAPLIGLRCLMHSDGTVTVDYDPYVPPGAIRTERLQHLS